MTHKTTTPTVLYCKHCGIPHRFYKPGDIVSHLCKGYHCNVPIHCCEHCPITTHPSHVWDRPREPGIWHIDPWLIQKATALSTPSLSQLTYRQAIMTLLPALQYIRDIVFLDFGTIVFDENNIQTTPITIEVLG